MQIWKNENEQKHRPRLHSRKVLISLQTFVRPFNVSDS